MRARLVVRRLTTLAAALLAVSMAATSAAQEAPTADGAPQVAQAGHEHGATEAAATGDTPGASPGDQAQKPTIQSYQDKISYAVGADMARDIQRQKGNLNVELLMRAFTDAMAGRPLIMSDEEVTVTVKEFDANQKRGLQHAKAMITEKNRRAAEEFFSENAKKEGVVTLPSGLQYKIVKQGDGKVPTLDDVVSCNYTGKLIDGTEIDSSYQRKEPSTIPVKGVIAGWTQALQLMPVGSTWQLFIPPQLAYGDKATSAFGPNTTLIFEVELLSIKDKSQTVGAAQTQPAVAARAR